MISGMSARRPPDALDRRRDLGQVGHRLDPDQVDAAGDQLARLLLECVIASSRSSVPRGAMIRPLGPMSPATSAVPPAAFTSARQDHGGGPVQLRDPVLVAVQRQPVPVPTERVREQDPRAGLEVAAVDPPDDLGLAQVPDLGRVAELEAGREEHRAHRPVGEDRAALGQEVAEALAGLAVIDRAARRGVGEGGVIDGLEGRSRGRSGAAGVCGRGALAGSAGPETAARTIHPSMIAGGPNRPLARAVARRLTDSPGLPFCTAASMALASGAPLDSAERKANAPSASRTTCTS